MNSRQDTPDRKFHRKALQVKEAQARVIEYAKLLDGEEVPLNQSCGRFWPVE